MVTKGDTREYKKKSVSVCFPMNVSQDVLASTGYRGGGDDLLSHNFQRVHHRDVTQTSGDRQSRVSAL